jgi:hypothetical protein
MSMFGEEGPVCRCAVCDDIRKDFPNVDTTFRITKKGAPWGYDHDTLNTRLTEYLAYRKTKKEIEECDLHTAEKEVKMMELEYNKLKYAAKLKVNKTEEEVVDSHHTTGTSDMHSVLDMWKLTREVEKLNFEVKKLDLEQNYRDRLRWKKQDEQRAAATANAEEEAKAKEEAAAKKQMTAGDETKATKEDVTVTKENATAAQEDSPAKDEASLWRPG